MDKALATGMLLLHSIFLSAQFAPPFDLFDEVGDVQFSIGSDVDGDGRTDVICATAKRLFWLPSQADGTFGHQRPISFADQLYRSLTAFDIDADGDEDLLLASYNEGIGIHFNNGDGTFGAVVIIYAPGPVLDLYLADLNGDSLPDALVGQGQGVAWLPGNGDGTFGAPSLIAAGHDAANSVQAEDLNGDGKLDVVVAAHSDNRLSWHENLGDGTFADYQIINETHLGPNSLDIGDFDGDGWPDIVCSSRNEDDGGAGLALFRNLGHGSFAAPDTLLPAYGNYFVQAGDMDGDGDLDLVSCHRYGEVGWFQNDGTGHFGPDIKLQDYAAHQRFLDLPDLNGDGLPDILYGINRPNPPKEALLWLASEGGGTFSPPALLELGVSQVSIPVVADMDQDGRPDVVLGSSGSDALIWVRNEGHGYSQPKLIARRHNYEPASIAVFDFNNDGWPDVLAGSIADDATNQSMFCVYLNNADGTFAATPPFESGYFYKRDLQMADMDGDGDLDMLWASPGFNGQPTGYVGWARNNGDSWGNFVFLLEEAVGVLDVLAADLNGDGLNDLVFCQGESPAIDYRLNQGNGNFVSLQTIANDFTTALYAQAADLNGDGLMDIIATADNSFGGNDQIAWWPGTGGGFFGPQQPIYIGGPAMEKFALTDYNNDGELDIITSGYQDFPMQWLEGQGGGSFLPPLPIPNAAIAVRGFELADMDNDGDLDIVGNAESPPNGGIDRAIISYNLANDVGVSGAVFFDENANGLRDTNEYLLDRFPITVAPEALAVFSDSEGRFSVYGAEGTYSISPQLDDCWSLTTMPGSYEIVFDGTPVDTLLFGVSPNTETPEGSVTLASAPTRCGFTVPFWLNFNNDGCWPFDGQAFLALNTLATYIDASPAPSSVSGDTLFWSFSALQPGESRSINLNMEIAGVEFIGSALDLPSGLVPYNAQGEALPAEVFAFTSIINCAYDPNDKLAHPARAEQPPFSQNYTLFDEPLRYTIRFQNTGTDTAFNVVLRDQLSEELNWETFEPGASSHPYEATLYDDGQAAFHFRNILLPDSTTNEPGSHGFVQFEIEALPGLDENTPIENTAGIYFDFNPPIITNTVTNLMVSALPDSTPVAAFGYEAFSLLVQFNDASGLSPDSWFWDFGDGGSSTLQHPEHTYASPGSYEVCLTAANAWGTAQTCQEVTLSSTGTVSVAPVALPEVFPNPARDKVWVKYQPLPSTAPLKIYNAYGQLVLTLPLPSGRSSWPTAGWPAGQYWLQTPSGERVPFFILK